MLLNLSVMKIHALALLLTVCPVAPCQTLEQCEKSLLDTHYRTNDQIAVGRPGAWGMRTVVPLFSDGGIDFYGVDRIKSVTGQPIYEDGAWVVAVIEDERLRESEAAELLTRLRNPHLAPDYAVGLKYLVVYSELGDDRDSEPLKSWMKCISSGPASKCQYPDQVPQISEVSYFQTHQCLIRSESRELLFPDHQPRTIPLPFAPMILKATNMMLQRFHAEDSQK
jgi:hypothetical protein